MRISATASLGIVWLRRHAHLLCLGIVWVLWVVRVVVVKLRGHARLGVALRLLLLLLLLLLRLLRLLRLASWLSGTADLARLLALL